MFQQNKYKALLLAWGASAAGPVITQFVLGATFPVFTGTISGRIITYRNV